MRMKAVGFPVFALVPFLVVSSAQAQKPLIEGIPPGVWKWYQADFRDVGIDPPIIWFGDATVDIDKATIRTQMKLIPFNKDLHPFFRGKINAKNEVDGLFGGVFFEPEDPAQLHGRYRKEKWDKSTCVTETITLQDRNFPENVLVFRRGTPAGC